eukprot:1005524_1
MIVRPYPTFERDTLSRAWYHKPRDLILILLALFIAPTNFIVLDEKSHREKLLCIQLFISCAMRPPYAGMFGVYLISFLERRMFTIAFIAPKHQTNSDKISQWINITAFDLYCAKQQYWLTSQQK